MKLGYALSSEEHKPADLARNARRAEEAGFDFAMISDHYHPWTNKQGNSAFVWSVLGAIAEATERIEVGTGVTCPIMRIHPAILAQASATTAAMMPGRFLFGVGSGENLNEHILGDKWPEIDVRLEMLEEAIEVIRMLWAGGQQSHRGKYYTVENARLYTLPDEPPPILISAFGPKAAEVAGRLGDGYVGTSREKEILKAFDKAGGKGKPKYGQFTVCWANSEEEAKQTAFEWWPTTAVGGQLSQELPLPAHFEQAVANVTPDQVAQSIVCGPDPQPHLEKFKEYADVGYDHIYVHQVGPDQDGFFDFYQREVMPALDRIPAAMKATKSREHA